MLQGKTDPWNLFLEHTARDSVSETRIEDWLHLPRFVGPPATFLAPLRQMADQEHMRERVNEQTNP